MTMKTRKTMRLAIVAAVAVLLISMVRKASAQDEPAGKAQFDASSLATSTTALGPVVAGINHALQRNYFSTGNLLAVSFPAFTYEPVDSPQTVTCPGLSGTCTIQADHWIELKGSSMLNDAWALWPWMVFSIQAADSSKTRSPLMVAGYRSQAHTL